LKIAEPIVAAISLSNTHDSKTFDHIYSKVKRGYGDSAYDVGRDKV